MRHGDALSFDRCTEPSNQCASGEGRADPAIRVALVSGATSAPPRRLPSRNSRRGGHMTKIPLVAWTLAVATLVVSDARLLSGQEFARAQATLNSCTDGAVVGSATLVEAPSSEGIKNVTILLSVRNLPAGNHAVHVHEVGACTPCSRRRESPRSRPVLQQRACHRQSSVSQRRSHQRAGRVDREGVHGARDQPRRDLRRQSRLFDENGASIVVHALPDLYCPTRPTQLRRWRPHRVRHPPAGSIAVGRTRVCT